MAEPIILCYNLPGGDLTAMASLCKSLGFACRQVLPWEYALPIGALAGIPLAKAAQSAPAEPFSEPMLVMCHLLSPQLDDFLHGLRASGLPPIPLKAVMTPTNVSWTSPQLRDELLQEHAAVTKRVQRRD